MITIKCAESLVRASQRTMATFNVSSSLGIVSEKYDIPALNRLKPEQMEALEKLVDSRHVVTILPLRDTEKV